MSTVSHPPSGAVQERRHWSTELRIRETWASLAIVVIWIAVAVSAAWGPDFVSTTSSSGGSTSTTTIPSGIAVALFACIGTWAVAKYGFGQRGKDSD